MTITVRGPNGVIVNFPDGTDRGTIDKAMRLSAAGQAPTKPQIGVGEDVARSVGSGLSTGTIGLAGLPGDAQMLMQGAGNWIGNKARELTGKPALTQEQQDALNAETRLPLPTSPDVQGAVTAATGFTPYEPQTTAGQYARTAAEFVPGAAAMGIGGGIKGAVSSGLKYGVAPGLASEAAGQAALKHLGPDYEAYARIMGALAGGGAASLGRSLITPNPVSPERAKMVKILQREGVSELTPGQMSGKRSMRYTESELGGSKAANMMETQGEQFTRAALRRVGIDASRATPETLNRAYQGIGVRFETLSSRNNLLPDQQFAKDLQDTLQWYAGRVAPPNRAPIVGQYAQEIGAVTSGGPIRGEVYQSLRSRIAADARGMGDADAASTLRDLVNTLDDAMERTIQKYNPDDLGGFREARSQYRNFLVIERAAVGAGEQAALGIISPAKLREAATGVGGRRGYALGRGELDELARAGNAVMLPMPDSGTASRVAARAAFGIPALVGGGIGLQSGDTNELGVNWQGGLVGAVAGMAAPWASRRLLTQALLSNTGRRYLTNQALPKGKDGKQQALASALMNTTLPYRLPQPAQ